jgi:GNAT superfamily N-acetyltransferase
MLAFETLLGQLVAVLLGWSLAWLVAAALALYLLPREWWRGFWLMSALWAGIDGGIAWYGLVRGPMFPADLAPVLKANAGLDVLYVLAGVWLLTRPSPRLKGFGAAVVAQGAFLFTLDVAFWLRAVS